MKHMRWNWNFCESFENCNGKILYLDPLSVHMQVQKAVSSSYLCMEGSYVVDGSGGFLGSNYQSSLEH